MISPSNNIYFSSETPSETLRVEEAENCRLCHACVDACGGDACDCAHGGDDDDGGGACVHADVAHVGAGVGGNEGVGGIIILGMSPPQTSTKKERIS